MLKTKLRHCIEKCIENTYSINRESCNTVKDKKISDIFYKIQYFLRTSLSSTITTNPIKIIEEIKKENKLYYTAPDENTRHTKDIDYPYCLKFAGKKHNYYLGYTKSSIWIIY